MKTLNKYILKKLTAYFSVILPAFIAIVLIVKFLEKVKNMKELEPKNLLGYLFFYIPEQLHYILPVAVILSIIILHKDLIQSRKIFAILVNGISIRYISTLFIVFGLLITLIQIANLETIAPYSKEKRIEFYEKLKGRNIETNKFLFANNIWIKPDKTKYIYFGFLDLNTYRGKDFILVEMKDKTFTPYYRIEAKEVKIDKGSIKLKEGKIVYFSSIESINLEKFKNLNFPVDIDIEKLRKLVKVKKPVSILQFYEKAVIADRFGYPSHYFWSKFYANLSTAFSSFILAVFTIGVLWIKRKEKYLLIFGAVFLYWYSISAIAALSEAGAVPAPLPIFVDAVFLLVGITLILKRKFIEL